MGCAEEFWVCEQVAEFYFEPFPTLSQNYDSQDSYMQGMMAVNEACWGM